MRIFLFRFALRLLRCIRLRRVIQSAQKFRLLDNAHALVDNATVLDEKERRKRPNRERILDFLDIRLVNPDRRNLDIAVIFRNTDKRRNHDKARRAARRRNFKNHRLLGLQNFLFEIVIVDFNDFNIFGRARRKNRKHNKDSDLHRQIFS